MQRNSFAGSRLVTAACRFAGLPAVRLQAQPAAICGNNQSGVTTGMWNALTDGLYASGTDSRLPAAVLK